MDSIAAGATAGIAMEATAAAAAAVGTAEEAAGTAAAAWLLVQEWPMEEIAMILTATLAHILLPVVLEQAVAQRRVAGAEAALAGMEVRSTRRHDSRQNR